MRESSRQMKADKEAVEVIGVVGIEVPKYGYPIFLIFFFFNDTATTEIYTLSLHDALPISAKNWCKLALKTKAWSS